MAKFTPGPAVAAVSGSTGGTTFSRNRGGAYIRNRSVPVTVTSAAALAQKARLSTLSGDWQGLSDANRNAWRAWADANPVIDALGQQVTLTGQQAYVGMNSRLLQDGSAAVATPPITPAPDALTSLSLSLDIGMGSFGATFAATPLGANDKLWLTAAVLNSSGIEYVENLLRFIGTSAAAQASPFDFQTLIEARLGTLVVGQKVVLYAAVFESTTGQLSRPLRAQGLVVST